MKRANPLLIILAIALLPFKSQAQMVRGSSSFSLILRSDSTTRTALISDKYPDQPGNQSAIIGSAGWNNESDTLRCRSLLYFDYGDLPRILKPEWITNAELVLIPVLLKDDPVPDDNRHRFIVRRVLQPWQDSLVSWNDQPLTTDNDQVITRINQRKKTGMIQLNVTTIVKNMFRYGNHGFLLSGDDSLQSGPLFKDWFASARIDNENLRPALIISYSFPLKYTGDQSILGRTISARDEQNMILINQQTPPVIITPTQTGGNNKTTQPSGS